MCSHTCLYSACAHCTEGGRTDRSNLSIQSQDLGPQQASADQAYVQQLSAPGDLPQYHFRSAHASQRNVMDPESSLVLGHTSDAWTHSQGAWQTDYSWANSGTNNCTAYTDLTLSPTHGIGHPTDYPGNYMVQSDARIPHDIPSAPPVSEVILNGQDIYGSSRSPAESWKLCQPWDEPNVTEGSEFVGFAEADDWGPQADTSPSTSACTGNIASNDQFESFLNTGICPVGIQMLPELNEARSMSDAEYQRLLDEATNSLQDHGTVGARSSM
ncbi:hypothetical protein IAU59_000605 [Kwoniella sp. CBS 9459]